MVLFGSVLALPGWIFHHEARIDRFILLPDTAAALVAAVLMLWAVVSKKRTMVLVTNLFIAFIAFAGLFWHQVDTSAATISWRSAHARVTLFQSLMLLLFCVSWLSWFTRTSSALSPMLSKLRVLSNLTLIVFSCGVLLLSHDFFSVFPLSISASASANTALYLLMLAVASLCTPFVRTRTSIRQLRRSGWLLVSFIALASVTLWFKFAHQLQHNIEQAAEQIGDKLQHNVDQMMSEQRGLLYRLAERLTVADNQASRSYLNTEIESYLRDYNYIDYLAVRTADGSLIHAKAQQDAELAWFNRYLWQASSAAEHKTVAITKPELTLYYDTDIDHAFIFVALPLANRSGVTEIVASVDFAKALRKVLPSLVTSGYFVQLRQASDSLLYDTTANVPGTAGVGQFAIDVMPGLSWQLRVYTNLHNEEHAMLLTTEVVLLAGWLATLLVMLSQKLYQQSQRHRIRLMASNDRLQHNIKQLQRLQLQQQQIMDNSADVICIVDENGRYVDLSQSCEWVFGYPREDMLQQRYIDFVHPEDKARTEAESENVWRDGQSSNFRNRHLRKDGSSVHLMWSSRYVASVKTLYAIARDISELVKAERYQHAQQVILKQISTERPLAEILTQICLLAEQHNNTVRASVMLKQQQFLQLAAAPSFSDTYKAAVRSMPIADNTGPCGAAAYQKSLVMTESLATDERWRPFAAAALAEGLVACWAMPMVLQQDEVAGVFTLHCTEPRVASKDELELMITCSRFAALAIEQAEHKRLLQDSEQRYRSLYEFNPEPVYAFHLNGFFSNMNAAGCKLLGIEEAELQHMHFSQLIVPEKVDAVLGYFQQAAQGHAQRYETTVLNRQGQQIELQVTNLPIWINGEIAGVFGMAKDITKRLQAEHQLRLFKHAVDATSSGVVIVDIARADQPLIYVNLAFEKLTGYTSAEALGRNCRFLQGGERDTLAINQIKRAIAQKQQCSVVLKNYRKDNSMFWNKLFLAPVPDESGFIGHYIGVQNDITEQKHYEQELAYNASHDLLTGLPNRALLKDRLTQSYQISQRNGQKIAILFIDLDGFKLINDSLGHLSGDEVLKQSSQRINACIRPGDTLARIGGDEFVLMLTDLSSADEVLPVTERILSAVAQPLDIAGQELNITASIGISLMDSELSAPMQMVQQADLAMYRAKQLGRNNFQWYSAELDIALSKQLTLRSQLKKAISNEEFELYYQPQIDAISGDIIGLEALLRWPQHGLGFISPDEFIPLAEESGEIVPLSNWVLDKATAYNKSLIQRGLACVVMAINVSSLQFRRSNFIEHLQQTLQANGLEPHWFEIELTESLLFENTEQVILKLQQVKQLGVKVSIDDFGTGYSSLSYLKRLPMDKLKIDRSFIRDIVTDKRDAAISKAIIAMAHHLDIRVIAEGVENEAQVALLRRSLCDEYQGFYFAKPMPAAELEIFLHSYQQQRLIRPEPTANDRTILLLDDEENILSALTRLLRRDAYRVLTCTNAKQALEVLALNQVQVILSDQRMPEISGTEFFSQVKDMYPDTIRIVLSGYTDLRSVTDAINKGAIYKFMTKPWQDDELRRQIKQAFVQYQLQFSNKKE